MAEPTLSNNSCNFSNRSISFLYQQFEKEKEGDKKSGNVQKDKPKSGYTIYVSGKTITEEFLKRHFSDFGSIVNVSMEIEKGRGFVTFSKTEATDRAIVEVSSFFRNCPESAINFKLF